MTRVATRRRLSSTHIAHCFFSNLRRYGGAYTPKEPDDPVDPKPAIEKTCEPACSSVWEIYKKCEVRIEEKGRGECSGYYMDYFKCIDKCAHKKLFNSLE